MILFKNTKVAFLLQNLIKNTYVFLALMIVIFAYGVGVGLYKWPPFKQMHLIKNIVSQQVQTPELYLGEFELLQYAFTEDANIGYYYYPAISSLNQIREANEDIFTPIKDFETAYQNMQILDARQVDIPLDAESIVLITYNYQEREYTAFAYGQLPINCVEASTATMIIPGTGKNESLAIAMNDPKSYHYGIVDAINETTNGDIFVLIKPNDDIRSWHDGNGIKINGDFIYNYHLNRGGSYSVSYLVESLAISKWINNCYERVILAGLSQGGPATLLNAKQSNPDVAIVSSGLSLINNKAEWSGVGSQLHAVPNYGKLSEKNYLVSMLENSSTNFFFSWGKNEIGTYRIEAEERITADAIEFLPNVFISIHDDGHIFPKTDIEYFLKTVLN